MSRRRSSRWHGLLPVNKKAGPTSHDVVDMARKALGEQRVGHTGTLDPMAEGLLLLCVGQATRLQRYLLDWRKSYRGLIRLGTATTTYDREGEATDPSGEPPSVDRALLDRLEERFFGEIQQVPPPFSAKKVSGKKLYELARSGHSVPVDPKTVTVDRVAFTIEESDLLSVEVTTSSGFYVRTLAHDIGLELGCGAHLFHLERLDVGPYATGSALDQDTLASAESAEEIVGGPFWVGLESIRLPFPDITVNPDAANRFQHGQEVVVFRTGSEPVAAGEPVSVRTSSGRLLGIGAVQNVLARGRTVSVQPSMVLDLGSRG